ncbi:hypothetical protein IQ07DRAFT_279844 [Pyrenochaeta sp. DS3sAY3a]|nr:hypothetical protein IQ07DRAFT_279844 [Pyrenochaeta sp. DS3sAY3a]
MPLLSTANPRLRAAALLPEDRWNRRRGGCCAGGHVCVWVRRARGGCVHAGGGLALAVRCALLRCECDSGMHVQRGGSMPPVATWTFPPLWPQGCASAASAGDVGGWSSGPQLLAHLIIIARCTRALDPRVNYRPCIPPCLPRTPPLDGHGTWPAPDLLCSSIHFKTGSTAAK